MRLIPFISVALFLSTSICAQAPTINNTLNDSAYTADAKIQVHDLRNHSWVLIDSTNKLTLQDIISGKFNDRFQPLNRMSQPAAAYVTYWIKHTIIAYGDIENWWLLFENDPKPNDYNAQNCYVDAWYVNGAGKIEEHQRGGIFVPRSQLSIKENRGLTSVFFSARNGETKVAYLKIYNEYAPAIISFPQLRNPIIGYPSPEAAVPMSVLSGVVFFFSILSFFFFFFVGDKAYLFFALYTLTLSQHYLIIHPDIVFADRYIPEHPWLAVPTFVFLTMGGFIFYALFGRFFINLPQLSKRLDTIFKWVLTFWIISFIIIVAVTAINRRYVPDEINFIFILIFLAFIIRISFFKSILVRFYVAGALWLFCFTVLGLLLNNSIISLPFNPWPVGQIGQLLIYSAGLAYKVRINEKARAQAAIIELRNVELSNLYEESKKQKAEIEMQKKNADDALVELKAAQTQLIQSEKMASLGELTAGIAHEIQNPLNFVNNFAEVNKELLVEMKGEIKNKNLGVVNGIADDLLLNEEKISFHGKRADAIVKNMLQHSRVGLGEKVPADINALADEYLRLAYHGLRGKDNSFNVTLKTDFDPSITKINIIPQDIGRVLLNVYSNAFYSVSEKRKSGIENYEPAVSVSTSKHKDNVEIKVTDNGGGIPAKILDKIFQPFFTTKPTGQGIGLGLSLSYDIIKAHGGEIKVSNKHDSGVEFIITLPILA